MREDDNKEETDLKRKKQAADQYYAEYINSYDGIMEDWRKSKKQMQVFINFIRHFFENFKFITFFQDELNKIQDELKNKREYFVTLE